MQGQNTKAKHNTYQHKVNVDHFVQCLHVMFLDIAPRCSASCSVLNAVNRLLILPAGNQTQQGALHGVKLHGVNERIHADVEKCDEHHCVIAAVHECQLNIDN